MVADLAQNRLLFMRVFPIYLRFINIFKAEPAWIGAWGNFHKKYGRRLKKLD
jgi:hypothetical protein